MEQVQHPLFNANEGILPEIEASALAHQPLDTFEVPITKENVIPEFELTIVCRLCDNVYSDPIACKCCEEVACRPCMSSN